MGKPHRNPVEVAVEKVGGPTKTAHACGVSNSSVHQWLDLGYVPRSKHAARLSAASGIPVWVLAGLAEDPGSDPRGRGRKTAADYCMLSDAAASHAAERPTAASAVSAPRGTTRSIAASLDGGSSTLAAARRRAGSR